MLAISPFLDSDPLHPPTYTSRQVRALQAIASSYKGLRAKCDKWVLGGHTYFQELFFKYVLGWDPKLYFFGSAHTPRTWMAVLDWLISHISEWRVLHGGAKGDEFAEFLAALAWRRTILEEEMEIFKRSDGADCGEFRPPHLTGTPLKLLSQATRRKAKRAYDARKKAALEQVEEDEEDAMEEEG